MNPARHQPGGRPCRIGRRRDGFALVLTLSLLALAMLLVVALAMLTRIESTVAGHARQLAGARHHAHLAMTIALGQLQVHAGPDTRVTATAESFGGAGGNAFFCGVWDTTDDGPEPLTWLVSGNEGADPRAVRPTDEALLPVTLVTSRGGPVPGEVVVPAQVIRSDEVPGLAGERAIGRYAWWVGDQGVKAPVGTPNRIADVRHSPFEAEEARRVLAQQAAADPHPEGLDLRSPENVRRLRHLVSDAQLAWLESGEGGVLGDRARGFFHDWSPGNAAVLANTAAESDSHHRGLRRDLSLQPGELGAAFSAYADYAAFMEQPDAPDGDFPPLPAIGAEYPRRRYRISPPVSADGLTHAVAPVLTLFLMQFNVRTLNGSTSSSELEVRARMVLSLWNPYSSALVPERLALEVEGLPVVTVQDSNGGATPLSLQSLFGGGSAMQIRLTPLETNPASQGNPDDRSWLPGRVYSWRTRGGDAAGGWESEFYNRTLSVANAQTWVVPAGQAHAGDAGGSVTFSIEIPPTTLILRLRRASDDALLATYTSPAYDAPTPVPPYRDNEYRFGFPFRLVESFDTVLADPGWWLTAEGGGFRDPAPPATIFRPFASGGNDPTLYVGMVTVSAPERLLDRVMGTTGRSYNEDVPLFELPRQPILSLGALQHVAVGDRRPFTIGNSWGETGGWNRIFDRYFLSGLAAGVSPGPDLALPLPNPTLRPLRVHPDGSELTGDDLLGEAETGFSSKHLLQTGAFNVNAVREAAWRAVLGSIRFPAADPWRYVASTTTTGTTATDNEPAWLVVPQAAFLRFPQSAQETYQATASTSLPNTSLFRRGLRALSTAEWDALAAAMASRVREKHAASGPFRTMADFLSPREEGSFDGRSVLQAAIEDAELNRDVVEFSSQWLTQADVVTALAPALFARSDTFLVRAYGEMLNPVTGASRAQAWCEAVVQRYPDPLEPADPQTPDDAEYHHPPGSLGRTFRIVSFRWLSPADL